MKDKEIMEDQVSLRYSEKLHDVMGQSQAWSLSQGPKVGAEVPGDSVYKFFYVDDRGVFLRMLECVATMFQGSRCLSIRIQKQDSIVWQTLQVHLCEIKQVLKRYTRHSVQKLLDRVRTASEKQLVAIRDVHAELMKKGYAGGSKCHAVYMCEQAGRLLDFDLDKEVGIPSRGSRVEMHKLIKDFAYTQLSPKLSVLAIPEWRSMLQAAPLFLKEATVATPNDIIDLSLSVLRERGSQQGIRNYHKLSRHELLVQLESKESAHSILTEKELHAIVREQEGNPQPFGSGRDLSGGSSRKSWSATECREYLLKRKATSDLQAMFFSRKRVCPRARRSMLEVLVKDPTAY